MFSSSLDVQYSASFEEAVDRFLHDLRLWAHACIERYARCSPTNAHDQLTYTTGWEPYLLASRDSRALAFLENELDKVAAHFTRAGLWRHGYWRMQEAHHGTEHFELFLGFMSRVHPGHAPTTRQLIDATEHLGNWCGDVPDWFDYSSGLYRSLFFGTDGVRDDDGSQLNIADHLRCANLLVLSHECTNDQKYLDLASQYAGKWAEAIGRENSEIPIGINRHGSIGNLSGANEKNYRAACGMAGSLDGDLDKAENILASGGVRLFLSLWERTGRRIFLTAAEKLLQVLQEALPDPDAACVADEIRRYRRKTGKEIFDARIITSMEDFQPGKTRTLSVDLSIRREKRPAGIGKRADMPLWYEDGDLRRHSPVLLALAAEMTDNPELAAVSLDLARTYFRLATKLMPDGREHGCASATVSAVARGHGRDNHTGMTTGVLLPLMKHFGLL